MVNDPLGRAGAGGRHSLPSGTLRRHRLLASRLIPGLWIPGALFSRMPVLHERATTQHRPLGFGSVYAQAAARALRGNSAGAADRMTVSVPGVERCLRLLPIGSNRRSWSIQVDRSSLGSSARRADLAAHALAPDGDAPDPFIINLRNLPLAKLSKSASDQSTLVDLACVRECSSSPRDVWPQRLRCQSSCA